MEVVFALFEEAWHVSTSSEYVRGKELQCTLKQDALEVA